jgi:hypothetical protein
VEDEDEDEEDISVCLLGHGRMSLRTRSISKCPWSAVLLLLLLLNALAQALPPTLILTPPSGYWQWAPSMEPCDSSPLPVGNWPFSYLFLSHCLSITYPSLRKTAAVAGPSAKLRPCLALRQVMGQVKDFRRWE